MSDLDFRLLNDFQRDFPLCARPFLSLARQLGCSEEDVLARLRALQAKATVSRVGAVFRPGAVGASTLAAMAVPAARLAEVAAMVSSFAEVNHNYEREHRFNLWFVATAANSASLSEALAAIAAAAGLPVMSLPLLREYRIDLGFDLRESPIGDVSHTPYPLMGEGWSGGDGRLRTRSCVQMAEALPLHPSDTALIAALQQGLPLVPRPYAELASRAGVTEADAIERIGALIGQGAIKRFGVIVRHRDLGFVANAMVVFDVPDAEVDRIGASIADSALASLCYRRERCVPQWPYNLFCMIHSRSRHDALFNLAALRERCALASYRYAVLFSRQCFKQRGARYVPAPMAAYG